MKTPLTNVEHRRKIARWRKETPPRSFGWMAKKLGISRGRAYQQYLKVLRDSTEKEDALAAEEELSRSVKEYLEGGPRTT